MTATPNEKKPRDIRAVFKDHQGEGFQFFNYNQNLSDMADELQELLNSYDKQQAKIDLLEKEVEALRSAIEEYPNYYSGEGCAEEAAYIEKANKYAEERGKL